MMKNDTEFTAYSLADKALNILLFKGNYKRNLQFGWPILLVEGQTDEDFYHDKTQSNVECVKISKLINNTGFYGNSPHFSSKQVIIEIIRQIRNNPRFQKYMSSGVFGTVDRDYGISPEEEMPHLYYTDTHDLETMLFGSDKHLFNKIGISISDDEIWHAKILSYELACIRELLFEETELNSKNINESDSSVFFSKIVEKDDISISKVLDVISSKRTYELTEKTRETVKQKLISRYPQYIDSSGIFNLSHNPGNRIIEIGFWEKVNGHDFCSAITYVNKEARQLFQNSSDNLNRNFENEVIRVYDYNCFKGYRLYKELSDNCLIRR